MKADLTLRACGLLMLLSVCASGNAAQRTKAVVPAKPDAVVALGRIQPKGEVIKLSVANAQDSRVDRILVAEGDFVTQGRVIAIFIIVIYIIFRFSTVILLSDISHLYDKIQASSSK